VLSTGVVERASKLKETSTHQKVVFCIFRFQSIWVGIYGDKPSFRIYKRKKTHALLRLAHVVSPFLFTSGSPLFKAPQLPGNFFFTCVTLMYYTRVDGTLRLGPGPAVSFCQCHWPLRVLTFFCFVLLKCWCFFVFFSYYAATQSRHFLSDSWGCFRSWVAKVAMNGAQIEAVTGSPG